MIYIKDKYSDIHRHMHNSIYSHINKIIFTNISILLYIKHLSFVVRNKEYIILTIKIAYVTIQNTNKVKGINA